MGRQSESSRRDAAGAEIPVGAVSFIHRHATSGAFKDLFREGMGLVEEAAAYLDGEGREESKALPRAVALAYATESMRLTTRLMQIASWLLLQRAVNEGELTAAQAQSERHRVKLSRQEIGCAADLFEQLPTRLKTLSRRSMRMQERVLHLDQSLTIARAPAPVAAASGVADRVDALRAALLSRAPGLIAG